MTNDKKAHQIAWEYTKHYDPNCCKQEWVEMGAKEMAIWKDKQFKNLTIKNIEEILINTKKRGIIVGYTIYIPNGVMSDSIHK